ncbi:MAG: Sir2 family NAD-dependent protein deacetylase [Bacteroidota bacterium]
MDERLKLVVLTGAGISKESGLSTFRDSGGLWAGHDVTEVASPEGWAANPELVLDFYNQRRRANVEAEPNLAHKLLAQLENYYDVTIVTQNVDDLHERGGSSNIIHLHGQLNKSRSTQDASLVYDIEGTELNWGDTCELGSQLRPHIVWFGEMVPLLETGAKYAMKADIFAVIGTSMLVYPAASLINYVPLDSPKYIIDPNMPIIQETANLHKIEKKATTGTQKLFDILTLTS